MGIQDGDRVKIAFTATYPDGELFDTSSRTVAAEHGVEADKRFRPVVLEVGAEPTIDALEAGLLGMEPGDTATIEVPHEELQLAYAREEFEEMLGELPGVGAEIRAKTGLLGEVIEADDDSVVVDFDPDRAGQVLTFEVEVLEVE